MAKTDYIQNATDDFINIASHELKTPISSIKAYAQILERKFKAIGDQESTQYIWKLEKQIDNLGSKTKCTTFR